MTVLDSSELTTAQRLALLESDHLFVDAGCDLLDADDGFIMDITDDLVPVGSSVSRGIYNQVHGTCRLVLSRELQWGWQRVRPYLLLSDDGDTWYRWRLGVYLLTTPARRVSQSPVTFEVDGFDKLDVLNTPYGSSYGLESGDNVIDAVEAILTAAGESKVAIDQTSASVTAAADKVYALTDDWTTLGIVNDLLDGLGYRGLWVDRDGYYRSGPYVAPADLSSVWSFNTASPTTTVGQERTAIADLYRAANVVVAISDDPGDSIPVEGSGIVTLTNQSDGPTSIDGRGGRTIRRVIRGTYETQAALEEAANAALDAEKRITNTVEMKASPNPVPWHFSAVSFRDDDIPTDTRYLVTSWSLPLDGTDGSLSLRQV